MRQKMHRILFSLVMFFCILGLASSAMAKDYLFAPTLAGLSVIDCDTDTVIKNVEYPGQRCYIVGARMAPDGKRYYLNYWHGIYVFDTDKMEFVENHQLSTDLSKTIVMPSFGISNDSKKLYLSVQIVKKKLNIPRLNILPPQLIIYDIASRKIEKNYEIPYCATGIVTLRNDPNNIVVVNQDVHNLNLKTGKLTKMMGILRPMKGMPAFNSLVIWDNESIDDHGLFINAAYTAEDLFYMIIDRNKSKDNIRLLKGAEAVFEYSVVISPDKKYIYGGMDEIYKIDFKTGETLAMDPIQRGTCYAFAITSDGKKVYAGPAGADVSVYDAETLKRIGWIPLQGDGIVAHRLTK